MQQTVTLTPDMAQVIASAIRDDIKGYIDAHREEYEAWLKERGAPVEEHHEHI